MPLSLLFFIISGLRRWFYAKGLIKSHQAKCPVVVVGNISVGGNGKTPFVIRLVELLQARGLKVGVISRGYGGEAQTLPAIVDSVDTVKFGDEPVLIYQRTGCAIAIGRDRIASCHLLVEQFGVDIIISDDGMQHYRLKRDMEIAIVDGKRQFGNGWLMPVGPLRELPGRLKSVDFVVYNGVVAGKTCYQMQVGKPCLVKDDACVSLTQFKANCADKTIHGICGIGNPGRFSDTVNQLGISVASFKGFADHYRYRPEDLAPYGDDMLLMTQKDAVKCREFAKANWWYLPIDCILDATFETSLTQSILKVIEKHGI